MKTYIHYSEHIRVTNRYITLMGRSHNQMYKFHIPKDAKCIEQNIYRQENDDLVISVNFHYAETETGYIRCNVSFSFGEKDDRYFIVAQAYCDYVDNGCGQSVIISRDTIFPYDDWSLIHRGVPEEKMVEK